MKIFALTTELTEQNGWGRYSQDVVRALTKKGIEVTVAVSKHDTTSEDIQSVDGLPNHDNYIKNYLTAFWYAWKLRKSAKECGVIHALVEKYSLIAYFLAKLSGKKYVITTHGTYGLLPYRMSLPVRILHHFSFKHASRIICISNYTKNMLARHNLSNVIVINNGIEFQKFASANAAREERKDILLTVGALKYRKGQHVSLEAFASIAEVFPRLHYYFVGDAKDIEYVESLRQIVASNNLQDRVHFLSQISDAELHDLYKKAKLFALTSITKSAHFEGFGLVYLEANASGVPVVGSKDSGAEDAVREGETGFLVPQEDVQATAAAMKKMLSDDAAWSSFSDQARIWAEKHDWNSIIGEYVKIYYAFE